MKCHVTVSIKTGPKRPKQFTTKFRTCIQFLVCNINNNRRAAGDFVSNQRSNMPLQLENMHTTIPTDYNYMSGQTDDFIDNLQWDSFTSLYLNGPM